MGNVASLLPTQTAHGEPENAQVVKDESQTGCSLLDKFPFEIRRQIYGYLLVNPMLGQTESEIEFWESKKVQYIKYGPPPSILHTNRQIYHEALDVLYGSNVFYIYCCGQPIGHAGSKNDYVSPIRRFRPNRRYDDSRERKQAPLVSDAAALKVRHWKVVVSSEDAYEHFPSPVLIDACKMMYASRPRSLEVLTIPRGVEAEPDGRYHDLNVVLRLFQILRFPKGGFSLRDANFDEICPDFHSVTTVPIYISQLEGTDYPKQLLDTIKGNTAVEIGADMYCATLNYARCFEDISLSSMKWVLDGQNLANLFRSGVYGSGEEKSAHPVELALYLGRIAHQSDDLPRCKAQRATVLQYLEPQYQRIVAASMQLREFIRREKQMGYIFDFVNPFEGCWCCESENFGDPYRHLNHISLAEAVIHLEDYAAAFRRDAPIVVRREIKRRQREFDHHYFHSEREELLAKMNQDLEMKDFKNFIEYFKRVFAHLEQQRLEIQQARRELFKFDLANDRRCDVDTEFGGTEDVIDWGVYDDLETEEQ